MKTIVGHLMVALSMLSISLTLSAHHSFSATFTDERKSTIEGVVTEFSFRNPHILIYVDVTNEDGSVTGWVSEGAAATNMRRRGWTRESVVPGQFVKITGDATHDGSPMTSLDSVLILDPETKVVLSELGETAPGFGGNAYQPEKAENVALTLEDGRPNLSLVWSNRTTRSTRPGQFASLELNEAGLALQEQFDISTDPQVFCDPVGLVRQLVTPHPVKITQLEDRVILEYEEFAGRREVFFDDRAATGIHTHFGDSIARYEDGKLIIETTNLLANQATNTGNRLTDQVTTIETYSRADTEDNGATLALRLIVSDPGHLAADIVHDMTYLDEGAYEFIENDCQPPLRERSAVNPAMSFFLTSDGPGDGANLGGLDGADVHCSALASAVGQGEKKWVAYLSVTGENAVNAKDRIGSGPWYNAKGQPIAIDLGGLHDEAPLLTGDSVRTERGERVNGRGDEPNRHDILTGSQADGTASNVDSDTTCNNWTSSSENGSALVGHFDREGGGDNPTSWNSAHGSRGCSQENLQATGGDGLFYCFATE